MIRPPFKLLLGLTCFAILAGCNPAKPFYLRDYGDLSYYLDQQVETKYPDVETVTIEETAYAHVPLTVNDENITNFVDMSLEDAISIALQNSKVIRGYGTPGLQSNLVAPGVDTLANGPTGAGTIYDVAIRESEPGSLTQPGQSSTPSLLSTNTSLDSNQGVESALAEFDAQFTTSAFWNKTDRPQNFVLPGFDTRFLQDFNGSVVSELGKKAANGTQMFVRNSTEYRRNNNPLAPVGAQALSSIYTTALEAELRQPLLRGRGAFINRMPVIFARIGTDQQLTVVESQLQNMLCNVEIRYWNLQCAYRNFEAAKEGRDSALEMFNLERNKFEIGSSERTGGGTRQTVARSQEQYFFFRGEVERSYANLLDAETDLRWLLGWSSTDGRFIRPCDTPLTTRLDFDWCQSLNEALNMKPQIRQERWELKKRQLAVAYAKNGLLPQLDAVGALSVVGLGDDLIGGSRNGVDFPNPDSRAVEELFNGKFQEYNFGFTFGLPVGFRRELANVRNAQLKVAREVARLEDMELDTARELAQTYRALQTNFRLAESHYNRWTSAQTEVESFEDLREAGQATVDIALDAQRRQVQAKVAYFDAICEYNKNIALMHLRKGTIMQYNSVQFGEGPWPSKAYDDAMENARRRGASREVNYGWMRPGVVSTDGLDVSAGGVCFDDAGCDAGVYYDGMVPVDSVPGSYPLESAPTFDGQHSSGHPTPAARGNESAEPVRGGSIPAGTPATPELIPTPAPSNDLRPPVTTESDSNASLQRSSATIAGLGSGANHGEGQESVARRSLGDQTVAPVGTGLKNSSAVLRPVSYQR